MTKKDREPKGERVPETRKVYWRDLPADSKVIDKGSSHYEVDGALVYWNGQEADSAKFWLNTHLSEGERVPETRIERTAEDTLRFERDMARIEILRLAQQRDELLAACKDGLSAIVEELSGYGRDEIANHPLINRHARIADCMRAVIRNAEKGARQ